MGFQKGWPTTALKIAAATFRPVFPARYHLHSSGKLTLLWQRKQRENNSAVGRIATGGEREREGEGELICTSHSQSKKLNLVVLDQEEKLHRKSRLMASQSEEP
ncbi:hypothetical protein KSP39_PZI015548 [Platanthera zijinensis]|uniref:Uncharacterized protein n=1 Tax=Platanthera zijinensis TaxID=2320716 RepID=A0AAP0G1N0_9ASPA